MSPALDVTPTSHLGQTPSPPLSSIALKTFCTRPLSRNPPSSVVFVESLYFSGNACSAILYPRYMVCAYGVMYRVMYPRYITAHTILYPRHTPCNAVGTILYTAACLSVI